LNLTYDGQAVDNTFLKHYLPPEYWNDLLFREPKDYYEVKSVAAAAVMLRREALLQVGGFDPLFYMYGEDDDLCWRLRKLGWTIGISPNARVRHWHGIVNVKRSFKWESNLAYSRTILHLKQSPRSLPLAFLSRLRHLGWHRNFRDSCSLAVALAKCVLLLPSIHQSRRGNPYPFLERASGDVGTKSTADSDLITNSGYTNA
jgi:GT2 family glycosyltransferase